MLDDISGVKTWDKVNQGMLKMYKAEVLAKLPVAQHFLFGSLLPYPSSPDLDDHHHEPNEIVDEHGHVHVRGAVQFGDCCGIKVPSAFAAAQAAAGKDGAMRSTPAVRRIPFD
jgi:serine/threonine-protein phosphatase 2A activator